MKFKKLGTHQQEINVTNKITAFKITFCYLTSLKIIFLYQQSDTCVTVYNVNLIVRKVLTEGYNKSKFQCKYQKSTF